MLDRATFQLEITVLPVTRPQFHLEFRNSSKQTKKPSFSGFIATPTSARGISSKRISTKKPCRKEEIRIKLRRDGSVENAGSSVCAILGSDGASSGTRYQRGIPVILVLWDSP